MQRSRDYAAAAVHGVANASVSADLAAHAKTRYEVLLATRNPRDSARITPLCGHLVHRDDGPAHGRTRFGVQQGRIVSGRLIDTGPKGVIDG